MRVNLESSAIAWVEYDNEAKTLTVCFTRSTVYKYFDVPSYTFEALISAPSVGQWFNANIKNHYTFKQDAQ